MQNNYQTEITLEAVSVIIVNYNAGELLEDCVRSALEQAQQVIVIDNASTDFSLQSIESSFLGEPRLKIVHNNKNVGFAAACNIGIQSCAESHILFLNPDCILRQNALQRLVLTLDANQDTGMVGGLLLNPDGSEQGGGRRAVPTPWRSFVRAFGLMRFANRWPSIFFDYHLHEQPLPVEPITVEAISGALMLVRRNALEEVGMWDEKYFLHCEDLDWCMRFRQKGWNILFEPCAAVLHIHGACSQSRPVFVEWHKHKGMVRFYRKFFQHQYPGGLMWLVVAGIWIRFAFLASIKAYRKQSEELNLAKKIKTLQLNHKISDNQANIGASLQEMKVVAVVGATSMVGQVLLPQLMHSGKRVIAYSRKRQLTPIQNRSIEWRELWSPGQNEEVQFDKNTIIEEWIWLAPIIKLPENLEFMRRAGAKKIVAVSTTSRFTKLKSSNEAERKFVSDIIAAEDRLQAWAKENNATWTILRPTLIYGMGLDKNINVIVRFISRFHFFPILGGASGLRQPIHVSDVAAACLAVTQSDKAKNRAYNISGSEVLSYREMVERVFKFLSIRPRFLSFPLWLFGAAVASVKILPPFRSWSTSMVERMNLDMVFDHDEARRDFEFKPKGFVLHQDDVS